MEVKIKKKNLIDKVFIDIFFSLFTLKSSTKLFSSNEIKIKHERSGI
jgi:hypothetical protein